VPINPPQSSPFPNAFTRSVYLLKRAQMPYAEQLALKQATMERDCVLKVGNHCTKKCASAINTLCEPSAY
jgi:hypothetical protein